MRAPWNMNSSDTKQRKVHWKNNIFIIFFPGIVSACWSFRDEVIENVPGTYCALPKGKKYMRHYLVSETLSNHRALIVWDQLSITMNFLYALVAQKHQPLSIRVSKIKKNVAGLSTLRSFNCFFVQNETHFWNGCHLDSQNVQTSPSQISWIKKSVHTHV